MQTSGTVRSVPMQKAPCSCFDGKLCVPTSRSYSVLLGDTASVRCHIPLARPRAHHENVKQPSHLSIRNYPLLCPNSNCERFVMFWSQLCFCYFILLKLYTHFMHLRDLRERNKEIFTGYKRKRTA